MRPIQCTSEGGMRGYVCVCTCTFSSTMLVCLFVSVQSWYTSRLALSSKLSSGFCVCVCLSKCVFTMLNWGCVFKDVSAHKPQSCSTGAAKWHRASGLVLPCLQRLKQEATDLFSSPCVSQWKISAGSVGLVEWWGGGGSVCCVSQCVQLNT